MPYKDKEKEKEYKRKYRETHKKQFSEYQLQWQRRNREKVRKYAKEYVDKNRDRVKQWKRDYYKKHREEIIKKRHSSINRLKRKRYNIRKKFGDNALKVFDKHPYCTKCNSIERLGIHHIDWNKTNDSIENLSVLCSKCHGKLLGFHPDKEILIKWYWMWINDN